MSYLIEIHYKKFDRNKQGENIYCMSKIHSNFLQKYSFKIGILMSITSNAKLMSLSFKSNKI